ncbi:MAG: hypothetical protein QOG03_2112 [Actinomycetota bacterium]|jgi:transglutaminase-like putative cysteine protease|nr:hypothetical protein [Actinomycetota bacterium]
MGRLYGGVTHLGPVVIVALLAHGIAFEGRRRNLSTLVSTLVAAAAVAVVTAWLVLPHSTFYGIPAGHTWRIAGRDLRDAVAQFRDVVAPAKANPGFILASILGVTITALLSDWAAFRMQATFEAAIPSFTIFLFTALLGTDTGEVLAVATYVAALLLFIAVHQADTLTRSTAWFTGRRQGTITPFLRHAAALGLVGVMAALIAGPHLPGAKSAAVLDWRKKDATGGGGGNRVTVSPLVDIRARLVNQANVAVFDVTATGRAYWRLTSLDVFDGSIWSSNGVYRPAKKRLTAVGDSSVASTRVTQKYAILALNSTWLPAAYEPAHVAGLTGVGYDAESGSLLPTEPTSDALRYTVESDVAASHLTPGLLEAAGGAQVPSNIAKRYLPLPNIPPSVATEAQRVAGTGSQYAKARALEDYFRSGRFTYDLNVPAGHDDRAMERFLFRTRRGFCEQFAGTYAVMARAVGLPTRVAVGFTPGEQGTDGSYHVFSLNAHAWPEVWLGTAGWVAFEPTPGRGVPGGEAYTGVPEAQAVPQAPATASTLAPTNTTAASSQTTQTTERRTGTATSTTKPKAGTSGLVWLGLVLAVAAALWLAIVPALHRLRRQQRHRGARSPRQRVIVAFDDADLALGRLGAGRRQAETPAEWAHRAARKASLPNDVAAALARLATATGAAWFSGGELPAEMATGASSAAAAIEAHVVRRTTRLQRLRWAVDPRPLLARPATA